MGTAVWIEKAQFRMNAAAERAAVAQLKTSFPTQAIFHDKVEQPIQSTAFVRFRHREFGKVIKRHVGDAGKPVSDDIFALRLDGGMFFQNLCFCRSQNAIEAA